MLSHVCCWTSEQKQSNHENRLLTLHVPLVGKTTKNIIHLLANINLQLTIAKLLTEQTVWPNQNEKSSREQRVWWTRNGNYVIMDLQYWTWHASVILIFTFTFQMLRCPQRVYVHAKNTVSERIQCVTYIASAANRIVPVQQKWTSLVFPAINEIICWVSDPVKFCGQ